MKKDEKKKVVIANYINAFYYEHDKVPSVREIEAGTGIPYATVHRYLVAMQESGEVTYNGYRSARTKEMNEVSPIYGISVLGTVACGPGQEEEQRFIEAIRMPESLVEKGDYFALIAKGESMTGAGIFPGDYVFRYVETDVPLSQALIKGIGDSSLSVLCDGVMVGTGHANMAFPIVIAPGTHEIVIEAAAEPFTLIGFQLF